MKKLLAMLALVVLLGSNFFGHSLMNALADETAQPEMAKYYTSIQIERGDTLWSIAGEYGHNSGMPTSDYVKELKNMNGLKEDTIHSGQFLTIMYFVPVE